MNEISNKQKEFETNYKIYMQNKSLKYGGIIFLFGVSLIVGVYILHVAFHISINPSYAMMFPWILMGCCMSIIAGKIVLKTRNIVMIVQFIAYFATTIEVLIIVYFSALNEWEAALKSVILLLVILIFVFYAAEKKFKQKKICGGDFILLSYRNVIIKEAE